MQKRSAVEAKYRPKKSDTPKKCNVLYYYCPVCKAHTRHRFGTYRKEISLWVCDDCGTLDYRFED